MCKVTLDAEARRDALSKVFEVPLDYLVTGNEGALEDVKIEDKGLAEKVKLIDSLDDEERKALTTMIDAMLTKKKMKDFLQKELEPA